MAMPRVAAAREPDMTDPDPTVRMPLPGDTPAEPSGGTSGPPPEPLSPPPDVTQPLSGPVAAPSAPGPSAGAPTTPPATWSQPRTRDDGRTGSIIFGLIILAIGLWFFAEQTLGLDLPSVDWGDFWPVILIAIGAWIVLGARRRRLG
jgi:hypothetical protein